MKSSRLQPNASPLFFLFMVLMSGFKNEFLRAVTLEMSQPRVHSAGSPAQK